MSPYSSSMFISRRGKEIFPVSKGKGGADEVSQQLRQGGVQSTPRKEACEFVNQSEILLELCKLKKCSTPKSFLRRIGMIHPEPIQNPIQPTPVVNSELQSLKSMETHQNTDSIETLELQPSNRKRSETPVKIFPKFPDRSSRISKFFKKECKTPVAVVKGQQMTPTTHPHYDNTEVNGFKSTSVLKPNISHELKSGFQVPSRWGRYKRTPSSASKPVTLGVSKPLMTLKNYFNVEKKIRSRFKKKLKKKEQQIRLLEQRLNMITQGASVSKDDQHCPTRMEETLLSENLRKLMTESSLCPVVVKPVYAKEPTSKEVTKEVKKCECLCFCSKLKGQKSSSTCPELSVLSSMMPPPPRSLMRKLQNSSTSNTSQLLFNSSSHSHSHSMNSNSSSNL